MRPLLLVFLLLCWRQLCSVATEQQRWKQETCGKPKCSWINNLLRKGESTATVNGELSVLGDGKAFCYDGGQWLSLEGLRTLWTDLQVTISVTPKDGLVIGRGNSSDKALSGDGMSTGLKNGTHSIHLSLCGVDCVGLVPEVREHINYQLNIKKRLAYGGPLLVVVGLALLIAAPRLSRSVSLFYGAGITIGIVASLLILLYMFSKFVPKRNILGLGVLAGGYTLFASFFYWFWNHALEVAVENWKYVTAYVTCAGLISFAVLYRMSPPSDQRSLNLIQWTIQLVGVACIYLACPLQEVGVVFVIAVLILYNISSCVVTPLYLISRLAWYLLTPFCCLLSPFYCLLTPFIYVLSPLWHLLSLPLAWFKPVHRHRFLTQEEYEEQGRVETKKALEELREYCRRHDNDEIWDKISSLHDSRRFTSFLSGKAHVSAQEQVDYEWSEGAGLDSMSDSESDSVEHNDNTSMNVSHRSTGSSSSSRSINLSSDSPSFVHCHSSRSHFTSTPRTSYRHRPPSHY